MNILLPLVALATIATTAPATAQPSPAAETVRVADLDLSSERGVIRLDRRIHRAAKSVCGAESGSVLSGGNQARRCVTATKVAALPARDRLVAARTAPPQMAAR